MVAPHLKLGRHPEAETDFRHALQLDPDYLPPYLEIGALLCNSGAYREALPYLLKAAPIDDVRVRQYTALARQMQERVA